MKQLYFSQTITICAAYRNLEPGMFHIYAKAVMREALSELDKGMKVGGELKKISQVC